MASGATLREDFNVYALSAQPEGVRTLRLSGRSDLTLGTRVRRRLGPGGLRRTVVPSLSGRRPVVQRPMHPAQPEQGSTVAQFEANINDAAEAQAFVVKSAEKAAANGEGPEPTGQLVTLAT